MWTEFGNSMVEQDTLDVADSDEKENDSDGGEGDIWKDPVDGW